MVNDDPAWAPYADAVYYYPPIEQAQVYPEPQPVSDPPPPPKDRKTVWIVVLAIVALTLVAGIGIWAIVGKKQAEPTSVPSAAPTLTVNQKIKQWRIDASPDIMTVSRDMDAIEAQAKINNVDGFKAACVVWQVDIKQLRTHLPSPDARITIEVSAALDDYDNASVICQHADTTDDVTVMMQYKDSGDVHIRAATEILNAAEK